MKTKTKGKSTALFIVSLLVIFFLAYSGFKGVTFGDYRIKPLSETINRGLDLQGGVSVVMEADKAMSQDEIDRTIELLSLRVNKMGVSETSIAKEGNKRIRIDVPGKFDTKEVIDTVGKTGNLKFVGPDKSEILTGRDDVKDASVSYDQQGKPVVSLELTTSGAKKFADATQKFLGQPISIYMDEDVISTANVQTVITDGKAIIQGMKDLSEVKKTADIIKSGALPVALKTASVNVVGPTLGANALPQSILAGEVGIGIVFLFMLLYYRVPGLIANIALVLYIILLLGIFSGIGATLTLSGIAGFLLTVGMAVDANVLIIERTKEELKAGKSPRAAIDAGFHRAMSSILDSNITTIISGFVLYWLGSGTVKGFALTLIIGVLLSMFTAITITKYLTRMAVNMGWFSKKWTIGTFGVHDIRRG
jgi:preprotein translocase subunit SecD